MAATHDLLVQHASRMRVGMEPCQLIVGVSNKLMDMFAKITGKRRWVTRGTRTSVRGDNDRSRGLVEIGAEGYLRDGTSIRHALMIQFRNDYPVQAVIRPPSWLASAVLHIGFLSLLIIYPLQQRLLAQSDEPITVTLITPASEPGRTVQVSRPHPPQTT